MSGTPRLLVDTQVLLWWLTDSPRLAARVLAELANPDAELLVSAAAIWEMAIKKALGRLDYPATLLDLLQADGMTVLPIQAGHAMAVAELPPIHRDPFDRIQVAQARIEGLAIVTADAEILKYDVASVPA